jgi:hypothetical protein
MSGAHDHSPHLLPVEIQNPEPPRPINFAFQRAVDPFELSLCRDHNDRRRLFDSLKRKASAALADHIAEHCKWFDIPAPERRGMVLQLELTISDRGAYVNYSRVARDEGFRDGWSRAQATCAASLPYGIADAAQEFYE